MEFQTDFSTTEKIYKIKEIDFSDFPQPHWVSYRVPDECYSFEDLMGKRALKVTWGDSLIVDGENPRPEVLIMTSPSEYWLSMELYIPEDFNLKSWMGIGQAFTGKSGVYPRYASSIYLQGSGGDGSGSIRIRNEVKRITEGYTVNILKTTGNLEGIVQRGANLTIKAHVKLYSVDGVYECWFNDQKVMDYRGETATVAENYILPIQHYKRVDELVTSLWWLNVRVEEYNFFDEVPSGPLIEPPPPGPFTIEVKPCIVTAAGAPLALLTGLRVIRTYLPGWFVRGYYSFSKFVLAGW